MLGSIHKAHSPKATNFIEKERRRRICNWLLAVRQSCSVDALDCAAAGRLGRNLWICQSELLMKKGKKTQGGEHKTNLMHRANLITFLRSDSKIVFWLEMMKPAEKWAEQENVWVGWHWHWHYWYRFGCKEGCSSFLSIHSLAYICSISFSSPPILGRQLSQRLSKSISTVSNSLCTASAQLHPCFLPCRTQ